jgi:hypothetical protein
MEVVVSSEILIFTYQVTRRHIPEYSNRQVLFLYRENLKTLFVLTIGKLDV